MKNKNYLEYIPIRNNIVWSTDEKGIVTLEIKNTGIFNKIAQRLFLRPKISYVHLDSMGSFIFSLIDGERDILALGKALEDKFGDKAYPLYERLAIHIKTLNRCGFISFKSKKA